MGVSGCGKSTIGRSLASHLKIAFLDADDYHMVSHVEKMRAGIPLTDADRWPWLQVLANLIDQHLSSGRCLVMACSALTEAYRDVLRGKHGDNVTFVLLKLSHEKLLRRLEARQALGVHFMPATLLDSQLATLEEGDRGMIIVSGENTIEEIVADILDRTIQYPTA
ncbi:g11148 [Coccomyxa elongata]